MKAIVIGAGVIGSAVTYRLTEAGAKVTLIDANRVGGGTSGIVQPTPSAPLAGTSQLHRTAAYMRCLSCAGAPRRPASSSGLSLSIPS
jgi:glycine/D-amino acid oxidase-like deaminating enzyme